MAEPKTTDEKLDELLALLTEKSVKSASDRVQSQASRVSGIIQSFRMNTVAVSGGIVAAIQAGGFPLTDDQKTWITGAVMVYTALILYSDTHRKIGA